MMVTVGSMASDREEGTEPTAESFRPSPRADTSQRGGGRDCHRAWCGLLKLPNPSHTVPLTGDQTLKFYEPMGVIPI